MQSTLPGTSTPPQPTQTHQQKGPSRPESLEQLLGQAAQEGKYLPKGSMALLTQPLTHEFSPWATRGACGTLPQWEELGKTHIDKFFRWRGKIGFHQILDLSMQDTTLHVDTWE